MYPLYLEYELFKPVVDYFESQGYVLRCEVRIGYCRADIVAFRNNEVTAIELKLRNWKKAIVQARNYQLGADYVYLVFPLFRAYNILRKAEYILRSEGIGLLVVNDESRMVHKIIEAQHSKKKMG